MSLPEWPKEFTDGSTIAQSFQGLGFFKTPQQIYGEFHSIDILSKDGRVLQTSGTFKISDELRVSLGIPPNLAKGAIMAYTVMRTEPTEMPSTATSYEYFAPRFKKMPVGKLLTSRDPAIARAQKGLVASIRTRLIKSTSGTFTGSSAGVGRPSAEFKVQIMRDWSWNSDGGKRDAAIDAQNYQRNWTGTRTPGYRKILREGGRLPCNSHSVSMWRSSVGQLTRTDSDPGTVSGRAYRQADSQPMTRAYGFPAGPVHLEQATRVAIAKLIKFSGNEIEGNLAQDLAQFGQTAQLLSGTLNRLTSAVTALKRGNIPGAVTALWRNGNPRFRKGGGPSVSRDLANNWLELQYGWKPLLQDIHGTINSLKKFHSSSNSILHVSSNVTADHSDDAPVFSSHVGKEGGRTTVRTVTSVRMAMNYRVSSRTTAFLAQTGFTNPINLLWEVLPWSFVVDWVLPIGPYLESLSAFHGMEFLDGFQRSFTRQITSVTVSAAGPFVGFPSATSTENGSMTREWIVLSREKLLDFPSQAPPSFRNPLSAKHGANALALLVQAFKR